jgi:DEAD/DEAH box helicase domain-containing protein
MREGARRQNRNPPPPCQFVAAVTPPASRPSPWLKAGLRWVGPSEYLGPLLAEREEDEYRLDREPDEDETPNITGDWVLIGPSDGGRYLRLSDGEVLSVSDPESRCVSFNLIDKSDERGCCDRAHLANLSPQRFGAPFLMGNAMPSLLQSLPVNRDAPDGPSQGRRLLSFTDSRQGTARFSAKLQQDAERTLTRAVIYHAVQEASAGDSEAATILREQVTALEAAVVAMPILQSQLDTTRADLKKAEGGAGSLKWFEMVSRLAQNSELTSFAGEVWRTRPNGGGKLAEDPVLLAELFLTRELFRRPRMQNNAETMGLARLVFPAIEENARLLVPDALREASQDAGVWSDLIHAAIDVVFRNTLAVELSASPVDMRHWISPKSVVGSVLEPQTPLDYIAPRKSIRRYPSAKSRSGLVSLIYNLIGGSMKSEIDSERAGSVLNAIWTVLISTKTIKPSEPNAYRLDLTRAQIVGLEQAWVCSATGRLLPYAPAGMSLTALDHAGKATPVQMPKLPIAHATGTSAIERAELRSWLDTNPLVTGLRNQGLWANLHDKIAEFTPFLRSQEHSAQIDRASLQLYEEAFKSGRINILNCSTTMEMGVDIPDVGMVVNTNVPPAPANYRQRVGRAGRRGEPWAMAFTFCKDLPLDRAVFRNPASLLRAQVQAPKVRMDSATLVQRHVNALVLGIFLRDSGGVKIKTSIGSFFGATEDPKTPVLTGNIAENFKISLQSEWAESARLDEALRHLVRGTILEGVQGLALRALAMFERMQDRWMREYEQLLKAQDAAPESEAVHRFYKVRAKRMREEFMMTELARRGFTPAYGFPVDVVSFDHVGVDQMSGGPSRPLDVAIRDYSPGTETVIDGLVHRSEGIRPSWGNRNDPSAVEDLRSLWTCSGCNSFGTARILPEACPNCGDIPSFCEILRPAGFLGTKKPHSAYERLDYVPPDPSRVTAEGGQWVSLVNPELGRFRVDRAGRLLTTASGTNGFGYAICIACGRAEAESSDNNPKLPRSMENHLPLQSIKGDTRAAGLCPANDVGSRRIRRRVKLGAETETDVYELQLDCLPATKAGNAMALALVAALREALSKRLGIDAEEMGTTVAPSLRADGGKRISLFLYDKATGGSGFAVSAEANLTAMFARAEAILDCPNACRHGCPDCILRRDVQFDLSKYDRAGALDLLRQQILPHMALPVALQVYGSQTRAVTEALSQALLRRLDAGEIKSLTMVLPADTRAWDLNDWPGANVLAKAAREGCKTRIVIAEQSILAMSMSQKLDLVRVLARSHAAIHSYKSLPELSGATVLLELETEGGVMQVATPDMDAVQASTPWGQVLVAPILMGKGKPIALSGSLSQDKLTAFGEGNAIKHPIVAEFNGNVADFGKKFWALVKKLRPQAFAGDRFLTGISYQDRYLRSPLTVRLLYEVWKATPHRSETTRMRVISEWASGEVRDCVDLVHNWSEDVHRREVIEGLMVGTKVDLMAKADCPHSRQLRLEFDDGQELRITLDQGFGAWRVAERRQRFDGQAGTSRQVSELRSSIFSVEIQDGGRHPSPMVIEW